MRCCYLLAVTIFMNRTCNFSKTIESGGNLMNDHFDLYTAIHKGQRGKFFKISMQAGTVEYADRKSLDGLHDELVSFREHMHLHAALEERFIHPLLSAGVLGGARKLEKDHRKMRQQFDDIV